MILTSLPVLFLSSFFTWTILWSILPWLRLRLLDQPNSRSAHADPIPRGGGIAIVLVVSFSSVLALLSGSRLTPEYPTLFISCLFSLPSRSSVSLMIATIFLLFVVILLIYYFFAVVLASPLVYASPPFLGVFFWLLPSHPLSTLLILWTVLMAC